MISGGFGVIIDIESGLSRCWFMGPDGAKRYADSGELVDGEETHGKPEKSDSQNYRAESWMI